MGHRNACLSDRGKGGGVPDGISPWPCYSTLRKTFYMSLVCFGYLQGLAWVEVRGVLPLFIFFFLAIWVDAPFFYFFNFFNGDPASVLS